MEMAAAKMAAARFTWSSSGQYTLLHGFTGGPDGGLPGGVLVDAAGTIYGTAAGGSRGGGVLFKLHRHLAQVIISFPI